MPDLRYYQKNAVKAVLDYLKRYPSCNPCIEAPTGSGKTPIIATLCGIFHKAGARTLCVAHRKELLQQTADKLQSWAPEVNFSVVSAGLNSRDFTGDVVVAGIQSIYRNSSDLLANGKIDFLIVDEAHLIPTTEENAEGMYQTLIRDLRAFNPRLRVIGLTATPYRLNSGSVCGEDKILTEIVYKVAIPELIGNKYLSQLINKAPIPEGITFNYHIEHGEFKTSEVNEEFLQNDVIRHACNKIAQVAHNRKAVLIFCCSREHCRAVAETLTSLTKEEVGVVLGDTPAAERAELLKRFKGEAISSTLFGDVIKPLRFLCNVEVLTTGFDAPNVDCVVLLRPTASPGLYSQMCGRGLRLCEGKENCLVLDFGGNIARFGSIDEIEPPKAKVNVKRDEPRKKTCPICFEVIDLNARVCPACNCKLKNDDFECPRCKTMNDLDANFCVSCGFQFRKFTGHNGENDEIHAILSGSKIVIEEEIVSVQYYIHNSKRSGKTSLRVDYKTPTLTIPEYVCLEHENFALQKAFKWWREHSEIRPIPFSVRQAYEIIETVGIAEPTTIKYLPRKPKDFAPEIVDLGIVPAPVPDAYPRTDNPLGLKCEFCGCESFLYEKYPVDCYVVKCARCFEVFGEVSHDSIPDDAEFQAEVDNFKRAGIRFYYPDEGAEDFYNLGRQDVADAIPF